MWYCYLLVDNTLRYTYNGSTNDLTRRLRQHNGELVGGAKATQRHRPWTYTMLLTGFNSHQEALACEWRIRYPYKSKYKRPRGIVKRLQALNVILQDTHWTNNHQKNGVYVLYILPMYRHLIDVSKLPLNIMVQDLNYL